MPPHPFPAPASRAFISQRLRLHYLDWGNPEARDLLLLHGGQDHAHNWDWIAQALSPEWRVIAPDLRGHGDSAWSPDGDYAFSAYLYDLAQLIHQRGRPPVTLVGHSLGGVIALRYAALYPDKVRRVVSLEGLSTTPHIPVGDNDGPVVERLRDWIESRRNTGSRQPSRLADLQAAYARMREKNAHLSEAQLRHLTLHAALQNEDGSYSWKFDDFTRPGTFLDISRSEEQALWSAITCPVLLIHGTESWMEHPETGGRAAFFRDARTISIEGAGHWMHHDKTAVVLGAIRDFISG